MSVMPSQAKSSWPVKIVVGSVTVKVYFTPTRGNDGYTVAWHEGARRERRMFGDLKRARVEAKVIAERLNAGRGMALALTGADRDAYLHALTKLRPLNVGLVPAIDEYVDAKAVGVPLLPAAQFYRKAHLHNLPSKTVGEAMDELFTAKKADGASPAYLAPLKTCLKRFSADFAVNIADVQTRDIDTWLRALKLSPRSRNNHRNGIVLLFNFAKSAGYLPRDQSSAAEATSLARKVTAEIEVFTPAEMVSLLTSADKVAMPFLVLGGFCGLRSAEILRLKWEDINWPEKVVEIRAGVSKTRTKRMAPLTEPAVAWLEARKDKKGPIVPTNLHRDAVEAVCKTSGIEWKRNGLRHGFGTYRMAVIKDPIRVAFEMGNSPAIIRQCYDRVVTEATGKLWFSIMPATAGNVVQMAKAG